MPWKKPTTTPVPDELFDVWLTELSEGELKVLLYIMRHTLGFKKEADAISYTQFLKGITRRDGTIVDKGALRSRPALVRSLKGLEDKKLIRRIKDVADDGGTATTIYELWWDGGSPRLPQALLSDHSAPAKGNRGAVADGHPQQTTLQQTTKGARPSTPRRTPSAPTAAQVRSANVKWGLCAQCGCKPCAC